MTPSKAMGTSPPTRDGAIARMFVVAREGIYLGSLSPADAGIGGAVRAANPCLRRILGYSSEASDATVLLFAPRHYTDSSARERLVDALLGPGNTRGVAGQEMIHRLFRCEPGNGR